MEGVHERPESGRRPRRDQQGVDVSMDHEPPGMLGSWGPRVRRADRRWRMIGKGGRSRSDRLTLVDHLARDKGSKKGGPAGVPAGYLAVTMGNTQTTKTVHVPLARVLRLTLSHTPKLHSPSWKHKESRRQEFR